VIRKYLREFCTPFVEDLAVHVHQQGHWGMARGNQVQPGCDALRVVLDNPLEIMRWLGPCEITDGAELFDQVGFARRSGAGVRRWESRFATSSVGFTVDATTDPAEKPAE
jgi:hypothetical protein